METRPSGKIEAQELRIGSGDGVFVVDGFDECAPRLKPSADGNDLGMGAVGSGNDADDLAGRRAR